MEYTKLEKLFLHVVAKEIDAQRDEIEDYHYALLVEDILDQMQDVGVDRKQTRGIMASLIKKEMFFIDELEKYEYTKLISASPYKLKRVDSYMAYFDKSIDNFA